MVHKWSDLQGVRCAGGFRNFHADMSVQKLALGPFRNALLTLEEAIAMSPVVEIVRDGTIQRFEYTYELAWKMMRRHFEWRGDEGIDAKSRKDVFREAARVGLIPDPVKWFKYNEARNETSHDYARVKAEQTYHLIREFAVDARYLLDQLEALHA